MEAVDPIQSSPLALANLTASAWDHEPEESAMSAVSGDSVPAAVAADSKRVMWSFASSASCCQFEHKIATNITALRQRQQSHGGLSGCTVQPEKDGFTAQRQQNKYRAIKGAGRRTHTVAKEPSALHHQAMSKGLRSPANSQAQWSQCHRVSATSTQCFRR